MAEKTSTFYTDLERRLTIEDDGSVRVLSGKTVIEQSIKMILSTSPGERVMLPEFGAGVKDYLFERVTDETAEDLESVIEDALARYEPRISVVAVSVVPDEVNNLYNIAIHYRHVGTGIRDEFIGKVKTFNVD